MHPASLLFLFLGLPAFKEHHTHGMDTLNYFSPGHQLLLGCLLSLCAWSPVEMRFGVIWAENSRSGFWGLDLYRTAQASNGLISLVPQMPIHGEGHNWNTNRRRLFKTEDLGQNISIFSGNKLQKKHLKAWWLTRDYRPRIKEKCTSKLRF